MYLVLARGGVDQAVVDTGRFTRHEDVMRRRLHHKRRCGRCLLCRAMICDWGRIPMRYWTCWADWESLVLGRGGWLVVGLLGVEWKGEREFEASLLNGVPNSEVQE